VTPDESDWKGTDLNHGKICLEKRACENVPRIGLLMTYNTEICHNTSLRLSNWFVYFRVVGSKPFKTQ
jgi:hypothetical protein